VSVVKINVIAVPEGAGPELEARFAARLGAVENMPGFEGFELLRPAKGGDRYFVYTRWASEEDFQDWLNSEQFRHGHRDTGSAPQRPPVGTGSELLEFEVVEDI
jgi:heme-degrading monooxygenase HmoA